MNAIEELRDHVREIYPAATAELTRPLRQGGMWSLDVDMADRRLAIQWSPSMGFGISSAENDKFGEGPDEVFPILERARKRVDELLTTTERTSPPFLVLLSRLREHRGLTQLELASRLGVRQASISGMERRDDVQLSTLQRVIEALGGVLEIFAAFPDARYRLNMPPFEYMHSRPPAISQKSVRIAKVSLLREGAFTVLRETGTLERAFETASVVREKHAVLEML